MQVKKRCRWLLSFTQQALRPISGSEKDPFDDADVDANALGWALAVVTSRAFRTRGPDQVRGRSSWGGKAACEYRTAAALICVVCISQTANLLRVASFAAASWTSSSYGFNMPPASTCAARRHAAADRHVQPQLLSQCQDCSRPWRCHVHGGNQVGRER